MRNSKEPKKEEENNSNVIEFREIDRSNRGDRLNKDKESRRDIVNNMREER